ncbi:hypothetical protein LPH50_08175 [Xylella taiwanensis]|nr:hypothetical protein [Xylella taiwanensis]MCD8455921.1 hypothetical protein [Xylella taiwanensis]MCD8458324.1 hypothetical protein [Xylella taiwanensis]MCD8460463.1 hypothetical protein [Xylella taiwanensis]MCD8463479.1 hypothetical protein [Xylella taiwanensis]UFM93107.1 hypothetical protein LPH39_08190 [Xylella taiwanensis]
MHDADHIKYINELEETKKALKEKEKYVLSEIHKNQVAYRVKKETGEPDHYVCQGCFDKGIKFVLQGKNCKQSHLFSLSFPNCKHSIPIQKMILPWCIKLLMRRISKQIGNASSRILIDDELSKLLFVF